MKNEDITRIKELLEKAEQGPWEVSQPYPEMEPIIRVPGYCEIGTTADPRYNIRSRDNAHLIVSAVNALPALLAERDRLREALRWVNLASTDKYAAERARAALAEVGE